MRRRLLALVGGGLGAVFVGLRMRRRRAPAADPAAELRRKLDEARPLVDEREREEFEAGEVAVDQAATLDDRRRDVHEQARAAINEIQGEETP